MIKKLFATVVLLGSLGAFAHEGHDHAPGTLKSNHGGVVKAGKEINLEYVIKGDLVELYPMSHEGKELEESAVKLTATGKPSKGKAEALKIESKNGVMVAKVDFKGAYRVEVQVSADSNGKKSNFKFQVER